MLNKAILMGRLTRDPEHKYINNNMPVCTFTLAIDRSVKTANGEKITDFINCVAWGKQADFIRQWFTKGMMAIVVGRIQSRNWKDNNGSNRTTIEVNVAEISFGETKKSREANGQAVPEPNYQVPNYEAWSSPNIECNDFTELDDNEGDVPF